MTIKEKIHKVLFPRYHYELWSSKNKIKNLKDDIAMLSDLSRTYEDNKEFFENKLVEEFVGYIPHTMREPVLKIFEEHAEMFQRWVLWQSHYINRKAVHDPLKITKYDGMMIYLKVLHTLAEKSKKTTLQVPKEDIPNEVTSTFDLDKSLEDINFFKENYGKTKGTEADKN